MTNIPILLFTLGALIGLPMGWRTAQTLDELAQWLLSSVVAYTLFLTVDQEVTR
jgi:hypothetical protein